MRIDSIRLSWIRSDEIEIDVIRLALEIYAAAECKVCPEISGCDEMR